MKYRHPVDKLVLYFVVENEPCEVNNNEVPLKLRAMTKVRKWFAWQLFEFSFAGNVPLDSVIQYPITDIFVASYRPPMTVKTTFLLRKLSDLPSGARASCFPALSCQMVDRTGKLDSRGKKLYDCNPCSFVLITNLAIIFWRVSLSPGLTTVLCHRARHFTRLVPVAT